MKDLLITTLETICPNKVFLQGTLSEDIGYPDSFITVWTNYTAGDEFFDNGTTAYEWQFSVIYYSNDPSSVQTFPPTIISTLKNVGFIPQGKGFDIASDVETHTGWAMDFYIKERA